MAWRTPDEGGGRIRYVLYNPVFVDSGLHRHFRQPLRALLGAAARLFGSTVDDTAARLEAILAEPPAVPLSAFRRNRPVPLTGPSFDPAAAARLEAVLARLAAV
jgi:hypothetical protein